MKAVHRRLTMSSLDKSSDSYLLNTTLVDWFMVCTPKNEGGFGFRTLWHMNQALLRKWLWRLSDVSERLWK